MSLPKSEGRKRFTFAARAASTRMFWAGRPAAPRVETTASWPWKAVVTEETDVRSASQTVTESGKVVVEEARLMAVILNLPELMSALSTGFPRDPEPFGTGLAFIVSHCKGLFQQESHTPTIATFLMAAILGEFGIWTLVLREEWNCLGINLFNARI